MTTPGIPAAGGWLSLIKSKVVLGNLIAVLGGFLLAARGHIQPGLLAVILCGAAMVLAGACAANNVIDRDIDAIMKRTRCRPLVTGAMTVGLARIWSAVLSLGGMLLLLSVSPRSALMALSGWLVYVGLYSLWLKRHSVHGTLIGSLSGAVPPVIGYCAIHPFDGGAGLLMAMFCLWQIPHSYAIALLRADDYRAAAIPQWALVAGSAWVRRHFIYYIAAFVLVTAQLSAFGYTGQAFLVVTALCGTYWVALAVNESPDAVWARHQYLCSLLTIVALSITMAVDFV